MPRVARGSNLAFHVDFHAQFVADGFFAEAVVVDPEKVSYEDLRENFLGYCVMKNLRSLKRTADGQPTLNTLHRLDRSFGGWRAREIPVADLKRFRVSSKGCPTPGSTAIWRRCARCSTRG